MLVHAGRHVGEHVALEAYPGPSSVVVLSEDMCLITRAEHLEHLDYPESHGMRPVSDERRG